MLIKKLFRDYNIHKVVRHNRISPHHPIQDKPQWFPIQDPGGTPRHHNLANKSNR